MSSLMTPQDRTDVEWLGEADRVAAIAAPLESTHDREGSFVFEAFDAIRDGGLASASVPRDLGGAGLDHAGTAAVLRRLGRTSPSTAVTLSMHYHPVATLVWRRRHGMTGEESLRRIAASSSIVATSGASDWIASSGTAVPVDGGYRVSATKRPISGAPVADVLVASARVVDDDTIIHFSVPMAADGVTVESTWDATGLRATGSDTVVLDDVLVAEGAVSLTRPDTGWAPAWNAVLGAALPLIMSAYLGIGDRLVGLALDAARARDRDGALEETVGEMVTHRAVAEDAVAAMLTASNDLTFDPSDDHGAFTLARKAAAAESLMALADCALEVVGGSGFSRTSEFERFHRDVHGCRFHPLPRAAQRRFCGRHALGRDPVG